MTQNQKAKILKAQRNHLLRMAQEYADKWNYETAAKFAVTVDGINYAISILEDANFAEKEYNRLVFRK